MTNLYDFLRRIRQDANVPGSINISADELQWIDQFLSAPEVELHFKAHKVGENEQGEPIMAQDYAIAGEGVDIFSLLTEAMLANYQFATLISMAHKFYTEHVPICKECQVKHFGPKAPPMDWTFKPHNNA